MRCALPQNWTVQRPVMSKCAMLTPLPARCRPPRPALAGVEHHDIRHLPNADCSPWRALIALPHAGLRTNGLPENGQVVHGLPSCGDACLVFGYAPAPLDEYHPDMDLAALAKFVLQFPDACPSTCTDADCAAAQPGPSCSKCCELHRTHKVVRGIIRNNGTGASGEGARFPIPSTKVLGFKNDTGLTEFMWNNPVTVRGNYIFASPNAKTMTFVVQQNTSDAYYKRKVFRNSFMTTTIPMQVAVCLFARVARACVPCVYAPPPHASMDGSKCTHTRTHARARAHTHTHTHTHTHPWCRWRRSVRSHGKSTFRTRQ